MAAIIGDDQDPSVILTVSPPLPPEADKKKKKRVKKRDPNAPRKPKSAFQFFISSRSGTFNKSEPTLKQLPNQPKNERATQDPKPKMNEGGRGFIADCAAKWKQLGDEELASFEAMSARDKTRYQCEMQSYNLGLKLKALIDRDG